MKFLLFGCYKIQTVLAVATAMEISITLQLPCEFVSPKKCHKNASQHLEWNYHIVLSYQEVTLGS